MLIVRADQLSRNCRRKSYGPFVDRINIRVIDEGEGNFISTL
jgi:hypothetical protein